MDYYDILHTIMVSICILFLVFCIGLVIIACVGDESSDDVYENVLANVTGKDVESVTTMTVVSTGKSTSVIPITSTNYIILTTKGNVTVGYSEYNSLKNNDTVVLTKNLNTSELNYNCKVEV